MDEHKKLLDALQTIQDECNKHSGDCKECPMYVTGVCGVTDLTPDNWDINNGKRFQALF